MQMSKELRETEPGTVFISDASRLIPNKNDLNYHSNMIEAVSGTPYSSKAPSMFLTLSDSTSRPNNIVSNFLHHIGRSIT